MSVSDLYQTTHSLLDSWNHLLDQQLINGTFEQRIQAVQLKNQIHQMKDGLDQRKRHGRDFDQREAHILSHVVPIFTQMLPPT